MKKIIKKIALVVFSLLILNGLIYLLVIPYVQKGVNSHLAKADNFIILLFFISVLCLIISIYNFLKGKRNTIIYILLFIAINIVFWFPKILNINCQACINGG